MKNFLPIANVQTPDSGIIILSDGQGTFLVQDVDSKFITMTEDEYDIGDYLVQTLQRHGIGDAPIIEHEQAANVTVEPAKEEPVVRSEVDSSFIKMLEYDKRFSTMTVYMHSGAFYCYEQVPMYNYETMLDCNLAGRSVGRFYNQYIKDKYTVSVYGDAPDND